MRQVEGREVQTGKSARHSKGLFHRYVQSNGGNVAIIFGLCLLPLMLGAGVAIDLSRALIVRERLGHTLDGAALAVGSKPGLTPEERQAMASEFFAVNYPQDAMGVPGDITITADDYIVSASASASVPTTILAMFGYDQITVAADVEVTRELRGLEVVMVLDNTGSMSGSKIVALRDAATDLVNLLFEEEDEPELLKIGLVPFANAVNLGTDSLANGWIDSSAQSSIAGHAFAAGVNVFDLYDQIPNRSWNGCVEERVPPYDLSDDPPSPGTPDTLWLPYFAPDEPASSVGSYQNSYLSDGISGSADVRQRYTGKYNGSSASSGKGPLFGCTVAPIQSMTNNRTTLLNAIAAMGASGYTHIPLGIAWGRRVISSGEPYTEGVEYDDADWRKAVVILTDGENTVDSESNHNKSTYSAYGYLVEGRLGTTSSSTFVSRLNSKTAEICDALKADNVEVYTITFQVSTSTVQNLMRNCATSDANYFDSPTEAELDEAFQAIAVALSNLRLSK